MNAARLLARYDRAADAPEALPRLRRFILDPAGQHRIDARVDELMAVCNRLEKALVVGEEARSRLLDALLREAPESC